MPMLSHALQSGFLLFREGLEALLVVSAIAAFLERAGEHSKVKFLYLGALAALAASLVTALAFALFFNGAHDDRMEALVMLVAAGFMFYVSGWLFVKQDPRAWQASLKAAADRALGAGTTASLAAIAFLAVFREGAETMLFLNILGKTDTGFSSGFWLGLAVASAILVALFFAIRSFALHLPLRPVFIITSLFLFVMGLRFVGGALQELQEMQMLSFTPVALPGWLADAGANASLEALAAQGLIVIAALFGLALAWIRPKGTLAAPAR